MKRKEFLELMMAGTMALSLTACGQSQESSGSSSEDSGSADEAQSGEESENSSAESGDEAVLDTSERVDLVFYVIGDPPEDETVVEDALNELLLEKYNATIDFQFSTWTEYDQKYNMTLTGGGADLIYSANWIYYSDLASSGAFLELDDLLDTYAPDLRDMIGKDKLNMCEVDGSVYAVPSGWDEYTCVGIAYREDLREKYDLPVPDSLENLETYLLGIKENDPSQVLVTGTATASSYKLGFTAAGCLGLKYGWVMDNGLNYGIGCYYDSPAETFDYWWSDDFVEDCEMFKRWADYGFWSRSSLSNSDSSDAYGNGQAVVVVNGMNPSKEVGYETSFEELGEGWESAYIAYGEVTGAIWSGYATQNATSIVRGCANPERAIAVLQGLMCDEELNHLVQYGIEGVHYEIDENGYYQNISDSFSAEGFNTWDLRNSEYKLLTENDAALQKYFDKYEEVGNGNKYPNVNIGGGFTEDTSGYEAERAAVLSVIHEYLAPLQAGLVDDVESAVEEFRSKLTGAGIETVREGYISQWLAYCEENGYN